MNWPRYLGPVVKTRLAKAVQDETGQPRVLIQSDSLLAENGLGLCTLIAARGWHRT